MVKRIFYGWWIVLACFFISFYVGGVIFFGFTAFFEPIRAESGWSYAQISFAASLRGLEAGLLAPLVGVLVDRWGPRRLLFSGAIITSLGLILLSRTTSLGTFYGAFVVVAIGMLAICLPLSLLVRHKPEQYGYQPDGAVYKDVKSNDCPLPVKSAEVNMKARQAIKSRTFWHITIALLCQAAIVSTITAHVMPYLSSISITRAKSALIASAIPLASIGGRIGLGWLGDKLDKRQLMAGAFAMMCGGLLCFGFASPEANWLFIPFLILYGIGYGGNNTLRGSVISEFFGRRNFGAIHGFVIGIMILGSIAGPPIAGWVFDKWHNYQPIWIALAGLAVAALFTVITTPPVSTTVQPADRTSP